MKKALFLLLLLPFIGFSQNATVTASELLVRWEGTRINDSSPSAVPMYYNGGSGTMTTPSSFSAANISGGGINFNSSDTYTGFYSSGWPSNASANTSFDYSKYYELKITAATGKKILVKNLTFKYSNQAGAYRIIYKKSSNNTPSDNSFNSGTDLTTNTSAASTAGQTMSYSFESNYYVNAGETLYIRIYAYQVDQYYNVWFLKHDPIVNNAASTSSDGPAIYGVVYDAATTGVTANNDTATTDYLTPVTVSVTSNDFTSNSNINSVTIASNPSNGTVTIVNGTQIKYTPNSGYIGTDSFTYKSVAANGNTSNAATVTITVTSPPAPTAVNDSATTDYLTPVTLSVTSNDTAASGSTISSVTIASNPTHGTVTVLNNTQIKYTPNSGYIGSDSFTYKAVGANGVSSTAATVSMTVTSPPAPTVANDTASTISTQPVTISVTSNDTAASGTTISSVTVASNPAYGTVAVVNGTQITYTPNGTYAGNDTFTYKAVGSNGVSSTAATVTVTVAAYVAPVANTDTVITAVNTPITIAVTSNDTAGNGTISSVAVVSSPSNGTASVSGTSILYTPTTGYLGSDTFTYKITNSYGYTATGTVNITVAQQGLSGNPLNGIYVISGTTQTEYPQFSTITAAVNYLNTYGISGPVKFLLKDTAYTNTTETFPFTINTIANSSATNTVTFKPYSGITTTITATNVNNYTGVPAIFILKGADYVIFDGSNTDGGSTRNLKFVNNDDITYVGRSVIWIASNGSADGATNNTIKNCYMKMTVKNQGGAYCVAVYSGKYEIGDNNRMNVVAAEANNSNLTISANDVDNVKQGVYINGNATTLTTGVYVSGNDLGAATTETIICPASFVNVNGFTYTENYIYNLYRNTNDGSLISAGVYVSGNSSNGTITRNQIKNITKTTTEYQTFGGVVLASTNTSSNILVANNFIADVSAPGNGGVFINGYGIAINGGGGYKIYNNSVSLNYTQDGASGYSAALYVGGTASAVDVRNNIFVNTQAATNVRRCAIIIDGYISQISNLDYNVIYSADKLGYVGDNAAWSDNPAYQTALSGWQSATGKEVNTISVSPVFASATDLHLDGNNTTNDPINNSAAVLALVTKDIDGQVRSTTTPDRGADEFGPLAYPTPTGTTGIYCDSATVWNGTSWNNGDPSASKDVVFAANYTQTGGTFYGCSMYVLNGASVNFISNSTAIITHAVNVQSTGTLTFESGSNLIQIENDANSGTATIKRNSGYLKRLDYTMWCAPVYDDRATGYQTLLAFSPATVTGRFYRYSAVEGLYIPQAEATTKFAKGAGYLIRMPNADATQGYNAGLTRMTFAGVFEGVPNNGTIRTALTYGDSSHAFNSIGNPYPSPISAVDFINANLNNIDGTLWIWRKTNNQTQTSYGTMNLSGYVANSAPGGDSSSGNYNIVNPFTVAPNKGFLNTAQGFIVKASGAGKEAIFRNDMRIATQSTSFFKSAAAATTAPEEEVEVNFGDRVWINATSEAGDFSQTLIAYNPVTTTGIDNGYDSQALSPGSISLYSLLTQEDVVKSMSIQTRGGFVNTDVVPLGFTATTAGVYTFSLDNMDGVFVDGQKVYLRDEQEGLVRDLTLNNYTFETAAGTFDNRFTVFYTAEAALGTDSPALTTPSEVVVYNSNNEIKATASQTIKSVVVYDTLGRMLYQNAKVDNAEFASGTINASKQVVIVNMTLEGGQVVTKKIMMN
ncbi:beta strand repeat-containing protein [Flavobacterium sp. RHBU_3]|uniref:beta strand repeat-containing protein n=1 Tax=Flavobacterium sp. RHBU_3 TaxID=3391184 RepID=UPI0039854DD9